MIKNANEQLMDCYHKNKCALFLYW